jgi:hypothetical protein
MPCIDCGPFPFGQICGLIDKKCICDGTACPDGCCDSVTGLCQPGNSNTSCGWDAGTCSNCADGGKICAQQTCQ